TRRPGRQYGLRRNHQHALRDRRLRIVAPGPVRAQTHLLIEIGLPLTTMDRRNLLTLRLSLFLSPPCCRDTFTGNRHSKESGSRKGKEGKKRKKAGLFAFFTLFAFFASLRLLYKS